MDRSACDGDPIAKVEKDNNVATNLNDLENPNVKNMKSVTCGLCEACKKTEDCTSCDNCIVTYIEKYIKHTQHTKPCLKRICHATGQTDSQESKLKITSKTDSQESKLKITGQTDSQESKPKVNLQRINDSLSMMELKEAKTMEPDEIGVNSGIKMEQGAEKYNVEMDYDKTVLEDFLEISFSENDDGDAGMNPVELEMCGKCLGCTAVDCGTCWPCIERDVVATKEMAANIICKAKKCLVKRKEGSKNKSEAKLRKRCGSCPGCEVAENCGICKACIRKQRDKLIGKKSSNPCTARKCHVLKSEKRKRCGECEGCQSLPCEDCAYCNSSNRLQNFCRHRKCQNPTWIKTRTAINNRKFRLKVAQINEYFEDKETPTEKIMNEDSLCLEEDLSLSRVDWFNKNFSWEEETQNVNNALKKTRNLDAEEAKDNSKQGSSKTIKRTKKCGECDGCLSEECGNCQSCKINQQFGDWLILGKAPCLKNSCKFPIELKGDDMRTLMAHQDDSSGGSVCPIRVLNGVLYDYRCYYCKKLPRVGSANKSELLRHYSTNHFKQELQNEFSGVLQNGYCPRCDKQLKNKTCVASHFGQTHEEVLKYLPTEAVALCPSQSRKVVKNKKIFEERGCDWPQVPEGLDPSSNDQHSGGDSLNDDVNLIEKPYEIVDGWIIEYDINDDFEPFPNENDPDYSGIGGVCSVCETEFSEVTKAAMHLHEDHHIEGGSSYIMRDCQNFIKSGFIKLLSKPNETIKEAVSVIKHTQMILETTVEAEVTVEEDVSLEMCSDRGRMSTRSPTGSNLPKPPENGVSSCPSGFEACSSHAGSDSVFWEAIGIIPKVEVDVETEGLVE